MTKPANDPEGFGAVLPAPQHVMTGCALLLDFDGTLVDIAPAPELVTVPDSLRQDLQRIAARMAGAVALISGRPIAELDGFLAPLSLAAAGEHGLTLRATAGGEVVRKPAPATPPEAWRGAAAALVAARPGTAIEQKAAGLVLHFRRAPEAAPACARRWRTSWAPPRDSRSCPPPWPGIAATRHRQGRGRAHAHGHAAAARPHTDLHWG